MSSEINTKDISVIVQGGINKKETLKCLKSIRKYLPEAEIILSTWEGSDVSFLEGVYDILLLNQDTGACRMTAEEDKKVAYNNINRQLLSTQEGLKKATRKYAMKLRSDLILSNNTFLQYFAKFQKRTNKYNLFERKILISTIFTLYSYNKMAVPFHISDWWFFGLKTDLETYFSETKLVEEPEFTNYFRLEGNKNKNNPYGKLCYRFATEQYYGYSCFSRNFDDIYMEDASGFSDELMDKYRECLVNNFIVLDYKKSGIYLNKYFCSRNEKFLGEQYLDLYNAFRYESEYKEFCDKDYIVTSDGSMYDKGELGYSIFRIYKHIAKLIDPNSSFLFRLEQLFIGIPFTSINCSVVFLKKLFKKRK